MNKNFDLYRKRLVPNEDILLKDDNILFRDDKIIVTKWNVLNKRADFDGGYSILDFKNNIKISKMISNGETKYYYVDIVEYELGESFCRTTDLLADVVIEGEKIIVLDLDEYEEAFRKKLMDTEDILKSLKYLSTFLEKVYNDGISEYIAIFEKYEQKEN